MIFIVLKHDIMVDTPLRDTVGCVCRGSELDPDWWQHCAHHLWVLQKVSSHQSHHHHRLCDHSTVCPWRLYCHQELKQTRGDTFIDVPSVENKSIDGFGFKRVLEMFILLGLLYTYFYLALHLGSVRQHCWTQEYCTI